MFSNKPSDLQNSVEVWIIDIPSCSKDLKKLESYLESEEVSRLQRYTNDHARIAFLVVRAALRVILGRYTGSTPSNIRLDFIGNGKPVLCDSRLPLFNVSHSGTMAVVAVSDHNVGIDIENCLRKVEIESIMRRFFSEKEICSWEKNNIPDKKTSFFRGWTRKEAILKATGEGIAGLRKVEISFTPEDPCPLTLINHSTETCRFWRFFEFIPARDYLATIAVNAPDPEVRFHNFEFLD